MRRGARPETRVSAAVADSVVLDPTGRCRMIASAIAWAAFGFRAVMGESFSEIFSHGLTYAFDNKIYEKKGIELIDYKPEEIKDFIIEMSERLESKKELNSSTHNS